MLDSIAWWIGMSVMSTLATLFVVWLVVVVIDKCIRNLKAYRLILYYAFHRKAINAWLKEHHGVEQRHDGRD